MSQLQTLQLGGSGETVQQPKYSSGGKTARKSNPRTIGSAEG
jgi:hypothetical protein